MNAYELVRMLRKKLADEKQARTQILASGLDDYPKYRDQCGYIRGISHCETWLQEVVQALHDPHNERGEV